MKSFKYMPKHVPAIITFLILACALCACSRRPSGTADIPRQIPAQYQISVAPFTQPKNPSQLIAGTIPENQGKIPQDALEELNVALRDTLRTDTDRTYNYIPPRNLPQPFMSGKSSGQPEALSRWLAYGQKHDAQYLLVPQVLDWHEREGSEGGVTSAAHVRVEFFLLNIKTGAIVQRSAYEERQEGLADNLLGMGNFLKRKGRWVKATDLSVEGMRKAIKDLGL